MKFKYFKKINKTLKGRLWLWYLISIVFILLLFVIAIGSLFWITLQKQIDHHVHIAVNEAHQIVQNYQHQERNDLIKSLVSAQGMTVVVLSPDGAPILETNSPDIALITEHQLQKILSSTSLHESTPIHFTESNIRFAAMPVQVSAGKGIVAVGYSTKVLYAAFYKVLIVIAIITIFLVLPITFIGYQLLKNQLQPLESIAHQAKSVSNLSLLSKRIYISSPTQELQTIQTALNSMLAKLEKIFKSEQEFFSDAAHTLKTPLAVLRSQVENINIFTKAKKEMLTTIDTANDTIGDLLFLAKINRKPQKISSFSLSEMVNSLYEIAAILGESKKLTVFRDIQTKISFKADKKMLQKALGNIIHNAVIYNKPNGVIHLSLKKQADRIIIIIKDTGLGIKKSLQSQIFNRFSRGNNVKTKGSGLGLAISKAVVENLGGQISLISSINKGTEIKIVFKSF